MNADSFSQKKIHKHTDRKHSEKFNLHINVRI